MIRNKIVILPLLFLTIFLQNVFAGSFGVAKYAGEWMSIGGGARALGMGGTFVAIGEGAETGYWNPAGLSTIQYPQILGMHSRRFGGIVNYDFAAIALPFKKDAGLALSIMRTGVDDIPETALPRKDLAINDSYIDSDGNTLANRPYIVKWLNDADYAFYLSYANKKTDMLKYGANVKLIRRGIGDYSAWGIGFDLGILLNPWQKLQVGANLQDATTTLLAWNTGTRELISPNLKTGVAYPIPLNFMASTALVGGDIDFRFEGRQFASQYHMGDISMDFHLGTEITIRKTLSLRLGSDIGYFTAGAGICLPRLDVDYAFFSHDELGKTHRVSLRISLEEDKFARK